MTRPSRLLLLAVTACTADREQRPAADPPPLEQSAAPAASAAAPTSHDSSRLGAIPVTREQDTLRARYPKEWEVAVPPGTRLDSLRRELDRQIAILPPRDLDDQTPLPIWFRVYLRKQNPDLTTSGPYQYPRTAPRLLQWMLAHPDSISSDSP